MVTECPHGDHVNPPFIFSGRTSCFAIYYSFKALDPGTHIWHAHIGSARAEGVFGSLIIRESNDVQSPLYDFDLSQHVIILNDWFNETFHSKFIKYIHHIGNFEKLPDSILINGRGVKNVFNDGLGNIYETPKSVFYVQSGYKYRFRIIDIGITNCPFQLTVENHTFTVIAADGQPVVPYPAKLLNINPGILPRSIFKAN
jgi:L-ascorbate oxidase